MARRRDPRGPRLSRHVHPDEGLHRCRDDQIGCPTCQDTVRGPRSTEGDTHVEEQDCPHRNGRPDPRGRPRIRPGLVAGATAAPEHKSAAATKAMTCRARPGTTPAPGPTSRAAAATRAVSIVPQKFWNDGGKLMMRSAVTTTLQGARGSVPHTKTMDLQVKDVTSGAAARGVSGHGHRRDRDGRAPRTGTPLLALALVVENMPGPHSTRPGDIVVRSTAKGSTSPTPTPRVG